MLLPAYLFSGEFPLRPICLVFGISNLFTLRTVFDGLSGRNPPYVFVSSKKHMLRIYTRWIVAAMQNRQPSGIGPLNNIHETMTTRSNNAVHKSTRIRP